MFRYVLLVIVLIVTGAFGAEAQEVQQTDPTNCSGSRLFVQNGEVWEIGGPTNSPFLLFGGASTQVECIGTHLLILSQTEGGYIINAPTTNENDVLSQFVYAANVRPDGVLFNVSGEVLWFSGLNDDESGVWGLYQVHDEWVLAGPMSNWELPEGTVGITVNESWILEAVETAQGVYYLVGFDVFIEGAYALNALSSICPADVDQAGCVVPWHLRLLGVPENLQIVDFEAFGNVGRDFLLEIVTPEGVRQIWAFSEDAQSFVPVNSL